MWLRHRLQVPIGRYRIGRCRISPVTVYLKMVEQFLPNLKQAPEGMFFAETDLDQLVDLSHQARMIADIGTDIDALGLVDKDHPSRNRRHKHTP